MAEKKAGLTPLQIEVLEWIKARQPPETFADSDDPHYQGNGRGLEKFSLVFISGSGDSWRVKLTAKRRRCPEVPVRLQLRSAARSSQASAESHPGSRTPPWRILLHQICRLGHPVRQLIRSRIARSGRLKLRGQGAKKHS